MSGPPFDLSQFLGRFHPLLVHLPIGFIVLLVAFEALTFWPKFDHLKTSSRVVLQLTLPMVGLSIACGYLLSVAGGYEGALLRWHRNAAYLLGASCLLLAFLDWRGGRKVYRLGLLCVAGLLGFTSHLGGSLTHGSNYLTEFAPTFIQSLVTTKMQSPAPPVKDSLYFSVVKPGLDSYCVSCHGPEKAKGKLRLDSWEGLTLGGGSGPCILTATPDDSELLKRTLSGPETDDHMPPEGKPQPPAEWLQLLRWWVRAGAPSKGSAADLHLPEEAQAAAQKLSGRKL